jgi:hypothetical protein
MRKRVVVLLLVLAVGGTVLWLSHGAKPGKVAISFQGFTKDGNGIRLATFSISNCTSRSVKRWGHYGVEIPSTPWSQRPQSAFGPAAILRPGQAGLVSLAAPTNGGAWKAVLFYSHDGWRCRLNDGYGIFRFVPANWRLSVPTEVWQSQWFDQ